MSPCPSLRSETHTFAPIGAVAALHRHGGPSQRAPGDNPGPRLRGARRPGPGSHATGSAAPLRAPDRRHARLARVLLPRGRRLMLSIGKLASGQASYYERQVARGRDDYYSGRGEAPGGWTGRGAAALGLAGQVEAAQFNALMAELDPSDGALERRLRDSRGEPKIVGFDLTFSAPKS